MADLKPNFNATRAFTLLKICGPNANCVGHISSLFKFNLRRGHSRVARWRGEGKECSQLKQLTFVVVVERPAALI